MGKRKRTSTSPPHTPPDSVACSSGRDLPPREDASYPEDFDIYKPRSSVKETMDSHGKHSTSQISLGQHHYHLSRSMFMKRSRHHYGNQYSRRNSPNYHKPSISYGKNSSFHDDRLSSKLGSKYNSEMAHRPDSTEFRERALWRPERIRRSSTDIDALSADGLNMVCGLCQNSLRQKPHHFRSIPSSEELSSVGVLVCGHIYHADCLEQKTSPQDKRDPPCPLCCT